MTIPDVLIIGAGPAGLAAAAACIERGLRPLVLEKSDEVAASWRAHYDRLHLHTTRRLSALPGLPIPRRYGRWIARDDLVEYLEAYREHYGIEVRTGAEVTGVHRAGSSWVVSLAGGERLSARDVVVATGYNHTPVPVSYPGVEGFTGELVGSHTYRNGAPYRGRSVLVVGTGNTGCEIAVDLLEHGAGPVSLAVRTPPHILPRSIGPWPTQRSGILIRHLPTWIVDRLAARAGALLTPDLRPYGLPRPTEGLLTRARRDHAIPVQDVGIIEAITTGQVSPVAALAAFDGPEVVLADGTRMSPDVVVAATGYRRGLEPIVGHLGVLDDRGLPRVSGGRPSADGLWFTGYLNPISGMLREIARESERIAEAIVTREKPTTPRRRMLLRG
ncbi:MAG: NAD(P)/FAD-dependent oxidoreductase [Mobilicoccus sp.]|nr:NAD(P)/FAD-dependent oxidoreductase [Mobilicoccus sp.]